MSRYWKAVISAIGLLTVVLTSLDAAWGDAAPDWLPVVVAVVTAVAVYLKANTPPDGVADPDMSEVGPGR